MGTSCFWLAWVGIFCFFDITGMEFGAGHCLSSFRVLVYSTGWIFPAKKAKCCSCLSGFEPMGGSILELSLDFGVWGLHIGWGFLTIARGIST